MSKKYTKEEVVTIMRNFSMNMDKNKANEIIYTPNQVSEILAAQAVLLQEDEKPVVKEWKLEVTKAWMTVEGKVYGIGNDSKVYVWLSWADKPRWELYVTKE
jgi:hypothetical protein